LEIRIKSLKRRSIFLSIDRIEPHLLRQRLGFEYWRIVRRVRCSESRAKCPNALFALYLQIQNVNDQRVSRLGSLHKKRPGQRIISFHQRERVSRPLQRIAKTVK